jgi:acyl-CoA thioesterase I
MNEIITAKAMAQDVTSTRKPDGASTAFPAGKRTSNAMNRRALASFFAIFACLFGNATNAVGQSAPKKVACVGDSITFGARIEDRENKCYPAQLAQILGETWTVGNFGVNGATLLGKGDRPWIADSACKSAMDFAPDIVVINLGANDSKPQNIGKHPDDFVSDYLALIERFRALPGKPLVYICDPVEVFDFTGGIQYSVVEKEIRPRIKTVAARSKCAVIDLKTPFVNRRDLLADLVHPNADGAKVMAETIAKAIKGKTSEKPQQ